MTVELCQFIPHALADAYRRAGWAVSPLLGHHGRWSMLAVRQENPAPTVLMTVGRGAQNDQDLNRSKDLPRGTAIGQARS